MTAPTPNDLTAALTHAVAGAKFQYDRAEQHVNELLKNASSDTGWAECFAMACRQRDGHGQTLTLLNGLAAQGEE